MKCDKPETVSKWEHQFLDCNHYGLKSKYPSKDGGTQCLICANQMRGLKLEIIEYHKNPPKQK